MGCSGPGVGVDVGFRVVYSVLVTIIILGMVSVGCWRLEEVAALGEADGLDAPAWDEGTGLEVTAAEDG